MLTIVLKRFGMTLALIFIGLASVVFFTKYSKPDQASALQVSEHKHATSEDHKECAAKIAGKALPPLSLRSPDNTTLSVMHISQEQPVIVIRYLGYGCSHCIEQLLALQKLSDTLKTKHIRIIAFSDDTPKQNQSVMTKYNFDPTLFTLASDPAKASAYSLGAIYPEADGTMTELHVSLVVRKGIVNFAHFDSKPMMDVKSLIGYAASPTTLSMQ